MSINYFFSTWSGDRRQGFSWGNYTHQHLQLLSHFTHNLSQITVGWPHNPNERQNYHDYMTNLQDSELNGVPIKIVKTNNEGQSYGQFSKAVEEYPDFDYYIYAEDDYVPMVNDFDQKLIGKLNELECDYLCGYIKEDHHGAHAAVSWGIMTRESLNQVIGTYKKVPYEGGNCPQVTFSRSFFDINLKVADVCDEYKVPYWSYGGMKFFGKEDGPELIVPIEYAKEKVKINYETLFGDNDPHRN